LEKERVGQSAISRLVTPKPPYQYNLVCNRLEQQEQDRRGMDAALMGEHTTLGTSSPLTEVIKVKNKHVQDVEEWIATTVKETIFHYIKSDALEKTVEKHINKEMARSKWEVYLDKPCGGLSKKDVAMAMKKEVSAMICFGLVRDVVGNHIVNGIDFDEIKARAMKTILINNLAQERVTERVEKGQVEEEEMNVNAGNAIR
jgi:hypothetical protein